MKHFFICILFTLSAGFLFAQAPEALIREMSGTVELKTSGSADWIAAREGNRIVKDTIISTGFKSMAILAVGNSTIIVRPLTRLSLAELMNQNETETINVSLSTGRIRVDVNPPAGSMAKFTVQTPTAIAAVRGTSFDMNTAKVRVLKGAVNYRPANGNKKSVMVNAGEESWIDTGTNSAVNPTAAAETARSLPNLPGEDARPPANNGARLETSGGTLTVDVVWE
ncbi:MAG: FecR family protein [Treponema sp.]|nr:FecR family protein [Treponema sp.]